MLPGGDPILEVGDAVHVLVALIEAGIRAPDERARSDGSTLPGVVSASFRAPVALGRVPAGLCGPRAQAVVARADCCERGATDLRTVRPLLRQQEVLKACIGCHMRHRACHPRQTPSEALNEAGCCPRLGAAGAVLCSACLVAFALEPLRVDVLELGFLGEDASLLLLERTPAEAAVPLAVLAAEVRGFPVLRDGRSNLVVQPRPLVVRSGS